MADTLPQSKKIEAHTKNKKVLSGVVISSKMKDTIVVAVTRYVKHLKYGKYVKHVKRYKVHDKGNTRVVGEKVRIEESKPISKMKHFVVI